MERYGAKTRRPLAGGGAEGPDGQEQPAPSIQLLYDGWTTRLSVLLSLPSDPPFKPRVFCYRQVYLYRTVQCTVQAYDLVPRLEGLWRMHGSRQMDRNKAPSDCNDDHDDHDVGMMQTGFAQDRGRANKLNEPVRHLQDSTRPCTVHVDSSSSR